MNSTTLLIGSALAILLAPTLTVLFIRSIIRKGKPKNMAEVNARSALILGGSLVGLPVLWGICVVVVGGFSHMTPQVHLLVWGTLGILLVLLGAFATIRHFYAKTL